MKYCKYCGSAIDSNSVFCEFCAGDLRIGAETDKNKTPRPIPPLTPPKAVRTGGDWCKLMYAAFAVWGFSFILLFLDWFTIDLSLGGYGDYSIGFNLFTVDTPLGELSYHSNIGSLSVWIIVYTVFIALAAVAAISLFVKRKYSMFTVGMILSVLFFIFALVPVVGMEAYLDYMTDDDLLMGMYISNILSTNAEPYILMIINVAAFIIMIFAKRGYIDEFGRPEKISIMGRQFYEDDLFCPECGKFSPADAEFCVYCCNEDLKSRNVDFGNKGPSNIDKRKQMEEDELINSGNYLICAECESVNPDNYRECYYCGAELYVPDDM